MALPLLAAPYVAPAIISSGLLATAGTQYLSKPEVSQGIIDNFINNKGLLNLSTFTNPSLNIFRNVIDTPSGQVFAPDADDIERQAEFNRELGKNITLPTNDKIEPLITTEGYKPGGLLSTPELETIDFSNVTKELPSSSLLDYINTIEDLKKKPSIIQIDENNPFLYDVDPLSLEPTEFEEKNINDYEGDKLEPIIATTINGKFKILDGHHRAKIAKKENRNVRTIFIPEDAYKEMKDKKIHQGEMIREFIATYDLKKYGFNPKN
tara:strand:+ start:1019 stop:1816 length:798 start_codon:yes stop_codon:yes gene_type:complete